ncbi:MAG: hypothetical protein R2809_11880 [Flavobacteriales bacterium]
MITSSKKWSEFADDTNTQQAILVELKRVMQQARWFGGKAYEMKALETDHCLPFDFEDCRYYYFIVQTSYTDHPTEYYLVPLGIASDKGTGAITEISFADTKGFLHDAVYMPHFQKSLFQSILQDNPVATSNGEFLFEKGKLVPENESFENSRNPNVDQSNSSIFFNEKYFMKIYRKLFLQTNPEVDVLRFLGNRKLQ